MSELVGQTIKGYEFLEHIGRGGFGAIYKAYQPILKREVAVKIILPQFANDPDFIRRFDVEAELIAQLEHPFIVPLYDYWRSPEGAYLVMRLLVEGSLRERMENEVIPPEEVVSIITNIADALHVAHRRNIVHRDVKPENILLDEDGRAYLTDFGIATLIEDDNKVNASDDTFSGSLIYAAPEQFTDSAITSQTDIYALGIILYELLMGSTPYNNKSITELVQAKLYEPVPDLEGTNEQYQARLNDIIARATASDIDNRYQSIRDFKVDIETALDTSSDVTQPIHLDQLQLQEPSSIFVSYSRDDEDFAQKLSRDLRSAGHTVWLDKSDIRGGEEWIKSITSGIANAYAFISIMSDSAQESRWVQREFLQAEEDGKPIFPVTASETNIPIYMKERHVLALYEDYEGNLETLLTELPDPPPVLNYAMTQESIVDLENPYKGLQAFQEYDSANFFGRDDLTKQLVERLSEKVELQRFLAVIGPSGSGKSSVVKAGLLPALRKGAVDNSDEWFYVEMFPGTQPFEELEAALLHVATESVPNLMDTLQSDARGLVRAVKQILPREGDSELLIVIDQFEEIFTLVEDEEQRQLFLYNLYQAVIDERSRIRLVVTLRADFYDKPLMYGGIGNMIRQRTEVVLPLSEAELEQTIVRPAEQAGAVFDPGLPQVIINDVMGQPGILPLLQYALTELFEQRKNRILSVKSYQKIGGVSGALAQRAEDTYLEYDEAFQKAVRQIFLRLVTLGEGTEDTRRRIRRSEVDSIENADRVVDVFGKYRLLTFDRDAGTREPTIEVAHEALIRRWDRLKDWLSAAREEVRIQRRLTNAVNEWKENEKRAGFLARDTRLLQFEEWANHTTLQLNELEREFLEASIAGRAKREQEDIARKKREEEIAAQAARYETTAQQFRRASYVLGVVVFIAIVSGIGAFLFAQQQLDQAAQSVEYTDFLQARDATVVAGSGGLPADADALSEDIDFEVAFATSTAVVSLQAWQAVTQDFDGVTMVQVPAGCFVMGTERESVNESPVHEICFDAPFWVDQTEVTNAQFTQFDGVANAPSDWTDPDQPRTNISWQEAVDFCALRDARLLTEAEWEYAARGIDSTVYPWGNNDPVLDEGNTLLAWDLSEPLAVGSFAEGASWVGALDMSGNVWEWVSSRADPYPYNATDGREELTDDGTPRILRGGAYSNKNPDSIRATRRFAVNSGVRLSAFGFRCAQDANPAPADQSE